MVITVSMVFYPTWRNHILLYDQRTVQTMHTMPIGRFGIELTQCASSIGFPDAAAIGFGVRSDNLQ
jgi:hypothetical protein